MIANMKAFGYMDEQDANSELKRNLTEIKRAAELLLNLIDLSMNRIQFEPGEIDKFIALRQSILDFRSVEVNPGTLQSIVIDPDNMESLQEVYGAVTDACRNRVINDMIRDTVIKVKKNSKNKSNDIQEQSKGKLKKALDLINEAQALSN